MNELMIHFGSPLVVEHQQAALPQVAEVTFTMGRFVFKGVCITMTPTGKSKQAVSQQSSATMQAGSMAELSVAWKDAGGNTVKVDGPTKWESTDATVVQITGQSSNPLITNIFAPGKIGNASIHATADADLGEGVQTVTATLDISVITGEAQSGDITFTPTGTHPPSPGGPQTTPSKGQPPQQQSKR
jgi:hypothetical protein